MLVSIDIYVVRCIIKVLRNMEVKRLDRGMYCYDKRHEFLIDYVYDELIKKLLHKQHIIHVYKATTTNTIYIALDYGVMGRIRISDHASKKSKRCRYNIYPCGREHKHREIKNGFELYNYREDEIEDFLFDLKRDYRIFIKKLNKPFDYYRIRKEARHESESSIDIFWTNAERVKEV